MPFSTLKKIIFEIYEPALLLRGVLPPERRHLMYKNILIACAFIFTLAALAFAVDNLATGILPRFSIISSLANRIYGLFLIVFSAAFVFSAFEAMHRSYYFKGLEQILEESNDPVQIPTSWEVATIIFETQGSDITGGFFNSTYGQEVLFRTGISAETFETFETNRTGGVQEEGFIVERDKGVDLATYAKSIYKQDEELRTLFAKNNINLEQFMRAAEWVTSIERKDRQLHRWWSRDNLGRIPGLGKTWSYGPTFLLQRFGHEITEDHIWQTALMTRREEDDEVEELEQILARGRQTNVLLLTNDVLVARQRTAQLYHKIREGHALPPLESRRVFYIDMEAIVIASGEKGIFEANLRQTFTQAVDSGNIILYFENIDTAIRSAQTLGVDLVDILSPYFESSEIQIVFAELSENYNKHLSHESRLAQAFDVIQMKDVGMSGIIDLLQQRAHMHERRSSVVFTIPSLEKIADVADRYFPTGVMPDKAFDLLEELVTYANAEDIEQILAFHVENFVSKKTNVPIGEPSEEEKQKLLSLEDVMHKRVIAQENAVSAVAKALRRARSGIANSKKPLGTFLFLGPTGVGKTETAKALAEVLFDDEEAMTRLDMSEFQAENAVEELIGFADTGKSGRLEALVRQRQYGVLLLDEFEKADKGVHDLFLQILDEGHFTDATGTSVNMRNLIIIATSNAGADLIWEMEKQHKDVSEEKRVLVDYIVSKGLFRPELLNRFDEIVVFHALQMEHVREIAKIHIMNFAKRIAEEKNITVDVTDDLVNYVASKGYDPQFGGRPLERAIMEELEQVIADEMLKGTLRSGDTFTFQSKNEVNQEPNPELKQ
ncbi:TPA: hypothetical protein DEP58_03670 [Patescibacteria group bacterium]|nr:hypothetical protein [Patescibacteria group bacterium]